MALPRPQGVSGKRLLTIAAGAAVVGAAILGSYLYADRTPAPHDVTIDVVAPPAVIAQLRAGLDHAAPGGFDVHARASRQDAASDLRTQNAQGALVLHGSHATILTAGAAGTSLKQVVITALTPAASQSAEQVRTEDVVPLPQGDLGGVSVFVVMLALLVPSVIGSVGLYLVGLRARLWWRVGAAALFAVLVAGFVELIADLGYGALTGAWPAMLGISALGAIIFATVVAAAQATFGLPGTGLAAIVLIFVGNATSGGSVPTPLLPDGYRQISSWLPNGAVVHGLRAAVYFDGHGIGQPLVAAFAWLGGAIIVLMANDLVHLRLGSRQPHNRAEIYATPAIALVGRWVRRERFHGAHEAPHGEPTYLDRYAAAG